MIYGDKKYIRVFTEGKVLAPNYLKRVKIFATNSLELITIHGGLIQDLKLGLTLYLRLDSVNKIKPKPFPSANLFKILEEIIRKVKV